MDDEQIFDLDILKPKALFVKLFDKQIDISFIPSGIAVETVQLQDDLNGARIRILEIQNQIGKTEDGAEITKLHEEENLISVETFDKAAELCAKIIEKQYPEITKEKLLFETTLDQLKQLVGLISKQIYRSVDSGVSNQGNAEEDEA